MESDSSSGSNLQSKASHSVESQCEARLRKFLECLRALFCRFLECHGHDQGLDSDDRGSLVALLAGIVGFGTGFGDLFGFFFRENESGRYELNTSNVKEDILENLVHACAKETSKLIAQELSDDHFGIVVDVFRDRRREEYMAVCLRYVDKTGKVMERFLGMVHIGEGETTVLSLKSALDSMLREHSLSLSKVRGQSFDGASRMNFGSVFYGLTTLVMEETKSAYYVHCFSHNLQSTLLAVAANNITDCASFFMTIEGLARLVNSCSRQKEISEEITTQKFLEAFRFEELGIHVSYEEFFMASLDFSCWGIEQVKSLVQVVNLFPTIVDLLDMIADKSSNNVYRHRAEETVSKVLSFEFVFVAHLMSSLVGCTNELSLALQRKDIMNALSLVPVVKGQLRMMRESGWETLMNEVSAFCSKNDEVEVVDMAACYGRGRWLRKQVTNLQYYQVDVFFSVIDFLLEELNVRFSEISNEFLACAACLSPANRFSGFDKQKLIRLAESYPDEFSSVEMLAIEFQLDMYISDMRTDDRFSNLKDLNELSVKLVETGKHIVWWQVYLLLKLVLLLPVEIANDERAFSMNFVRQQLERSITDQLLSDSLITLVERDTFSRVPDDNVLKRFQALQASRKQV